MLRALATALALLAALPTHAAPAADPGRLEARAQELFQALQEDRSVRAAKTFAPALRAELTPPRLTASWRQLVASLGRLQGWTFDAAASEGAHRVYDLALERGRVRAALEFSPAGEVASFSLSPPLRPPAPSADARAVEVATGQQPLQVLGTLLLPRATGPAPAALLLGDLGADRDGARGQGPRLLRDLAEALAARGVVTLRLERRSTVWPGDGTSTPESDVVADAVAALRQLRDRSEVDGARLFVVGHGLGGVLAPEVAERGGPVAALAILGAPARALPLALLEAARAANRLAPGELALYQRLAERALANRLDEGEKFEGRGEEFWRDLATRDPLSRLRRLRRPTLVLRGEGDLVAAAEDVPAWKGSLAGLAGAELQTLAGLDHDLAQPRAAKTSPAALKLVADFLLAAPPAQVPSPPPPKSL